MKLFELLPLPPNTVRHVFARSGQSVRGTYVRSQRQVEAVCRSMRDWNLYVQLNPTLETARQKYRPASRDIAAIQAVLIDLDPVSDKAWPIGAANTVAAALRDSGQVPIQSIALIDSGRGAQLWLLHPPTEPTRERVGKIAAFVHRVAQAVGECEGCRVDTSCSDAARLARMPGSVNQKTGRTVVVIYGAEAGEPWIDQLPDTPPPERRASGALPAGIRLSAIIPRLTGAAGDFLLLGKREPGRHARCFATVKSLHEAGVDATQALSLLQHAATLCDPQLPSPEVERVWRQVYDGDN